MIKVVQTRMSVEDWILVEDNPIQRNTEIHAKKARNKHLKYLSATHSRVSAAELPDGTWLKLDGHTRAYLWKEGSLQRPDVLNVDLYICENVSEAEELYKQFDNTDAAETITDKLYGAYRLYGFNPKSSLLLYGGVVSCLNILTTRKNRVNIYTDILPWMDVLEMVDQYHFSQNRFTSGVFAALLLTCRLDGEGAMQFWKNYNNDAGIKMDRRRDGVQALTEIVSQKRAAKNLSGWGSINDVFSKALSCYEAYRKGIEFTCGVKGLSVQDYLDKLSKMNGRVRRQFLPAA